MSYVPSVPFSHSLTLNHGNSQPKTPDGRQQSQKLLRSSNSLAGLVKFARNPIENIGQAVENWYDGTTKEERAKRQCLADRKQLLYLKMRMVSLSLVPNGAVAANAD